MNWGTRIVIAFVLFVGVIATLVTISMQQDVSLVASDYYMQEIAYQDQIERISNKNNLEEPPKVVVDKVSGIIKLSLAGNDLAGEVHFFRPSKASMDKKYKLKTNAEGIQLFSGKDFEKGLWKVKVTWTNESIPYYSEHTIVL